MVLVTPTGSDLSIHLLIPIFCQNHFSTLRRSIPIYRCRAFCIVTRFSTHELVHCVQEPRPKQHTERPHTGPCKTHFYILRPPPIAFIRPSQFTFACPRLQAAKPLLTVHQKEQLLAFLD